jgi:hypothetical protein
LRWTGIGETRTLASHNPRVYQARIIGDWLINGKDPWGTGQLSFGIVAENVVAL